MQCFLMTIVLALTGLDLSMVQAQSSIGRESLRGLQGEEVVITEIQPDAQTDGLSPEAVLSTVELFLRSSGIRIFDHPHCDTLGQVPPELFRPTFLGPTNLPCLSNSPQTVT